MTDDALGLRLQQIERRTITEIDSSDPSCERCAGTGWVCEEHDDKPWGDMTGPWPTSCHCGGAGKPCPECNPLAHSSDANRDHAAAGGR
jgi:hypothetical protein